MTVEETKSPELEKDQTQQTVVATEVEDSSTYDPFKAAREMDEAVIAGRDGEEGEQPKAEEKAPEKGTDEGTEPPKEEKPLEIEEGKKYTAEELAQLEELARKGYEYEQYLNGLDERKQVRQERQRRREEILREIDQDERWKKLNQDMYGDYADDYMSEFDGKVGRMIDRQIAQRLNGVLREVEITKDQRIAREKERMTDGFASHIEEAYGMTTDEARKIAKLAMTELEQKMPNFNPQAYGVELAVFADTELARVNAEMNKNRITELETLRAKVAEYENAAQQTRTPSSTAQAAERTLGIKDAEYKRNGSIPAGRGGVNDNAESEDEAALNFFHRGG